MYGGRPYYNSELSESDAQQLYNENIGVRIPFSNHYVEQYEYAINAWLLEKYHREGNAVIVTNDDLARWIREDFPKYRIEASVIKNINTHDKIKKAFDLYDTVVLPMSINEMTAFLKKIEHKERITLFANAGCALTCPSKICYPSFSKANKFTGVEPQCSQSIKYREVRGMIDFDIKALADLGFHRFKLLREQPGYNRGY